MSDKGLEIQSGMWGQEFDNLLRGLTGGYLVGIPLIYTMETWWIGETVSMPHALLFVAIAYLVSLSFVAVTGFRGTVPGARHPLTEALESIALAVLATTVLLALLGQVQRDSPLDVIVGRIAVDTLPVSLGIAVTNLILAPRETRLGDESESRRGEPTDRPRFAALVLDLGAAFAGALFIGVNIAPTEEVPMLATAVSGLAVPVIIVFSLMLTYAIVFEAGFGGMESRRRTSGPFQQPATETVLAYLIALVTCAGLLTLYGQVDIGDDWTVAFTQIIVLGLPASIGAAAGRLAV